MMISKNEPFIGILAGMGPRSTAPFLEKVLDQCQMRYGASSDMDFPHMLIYSLPTPFYVNHPIDNEAMVKAIMAGLKKLEKCGVDFIAMPCNMAHSYFQQLNTSIEVPLLNMIDLTVESLIATNNKVALLGTEATINTGMYQGKLMDKGIHPVHNNVIQQSINEILSELKSNNDTQAAAKKWKMLYDYLKQKDSDMILSVCTDLQSVIVSKPDQKIPIIDAADCLAKEVVKLWMDMHSN